MSVPALRQPKTVINDKKQVAKCISTENKYVIVTLRDNKKLVVSADSYEGIITAGEMYECVFCRKTISLSSSLKENHVKTDEHRTNTELYPHQMEFSEHLIRMLPKSTSYCTICNVVISNMYLSRHISNESHNFELGKAILRAETYQPMN